MHPGGERAEFDRLVLADDDRAAQAHRVSGDHRGGPERTAHARCQRQVAAHQAAAVKAITDHAYSVGFAKGYLISAGIALLGLIITVVAIRVKREDLAGLNPMAGPADRAAG